MRRVDAAVELNITAQVEAIGHVPCIGQKLRLGRVALAPVPLLLQRRVELIGVLHALHVAARAGIAVPVPGTTDVATRLEDAHFKAQAAQAVQHVHTGKARPDDGGIEGALGPRANLIVLLWHRLATSPSIVALATMAVPRPGARTGALELREQPAEAGDRLANIIAAQGVPIGGRINGNDGLA